MSLGLAATDNQNGTATLTPAGADAGTTTTLFAGRYNQPTPAWFQAGTVVANAPFTFAGAPGAWWAYAQGTAGGQPAVSPPVAFTLSSSTSAVYTRAKQAVLARAQALTLAAGASGSPAALPADRMVGFPLFVPEVLPVLPAKPCLVVAGLPEGSERYRPRVNVLDDLAWPCLVSVVDTAHSPLFQGANPTWERWREQISSALRYQRLLSVPEVYTVEPDPRPVLSFRPRDYQISWGGLLFWAVTRVPRG